MSNTFSSIISAITAAATAGNGALATELAGLLHVGSTTAGLNFKDKTMTTTWFNANQATAVPLVAGGWTIIPG